MPDVSPARHPHRDVALLAARATVIVLLLVGLGILAGMFLGDLLVHVFQMLHLSRRGTGG